MMNTVKLAYALATIQVLLMTAFIPGCTTPPRGEHFSVDDLCVHAEEICRETDNFRREYDAMPAEERKDLLPVLNSYTDQCLKARQRCSQRRRAP